MRQKLNENPLAQVALIGVLLVLAGFLVLSSMGGGASEGAEESASTTSTATVTGPAGSATVTATVTPSGEAPAAVAPGAPAPEVPAPPLPHAVVAAFDANETVALLIVKPSGIEDRMVASTVRLLGGLPQVASFVVPADQISRYAAITQGVKVERVPALVVLRPKHLDGGTPTASLSYGFQSPQSIVQAVVDANYRGGTYSYHP
jgi:hypothetical protein